MMCDTYFAECADCKKSLDILLADFATARNEVKVFCEKHLPEGATHGVLWEFMQSSGRREKAFIQLLTENALRHWRGNHPNDEEATVANAFGLRWNNPGWTLIDQF